MAMICSFGNVTGAGLASDTYAQAFVTECPLSFFPMPAILNVSAAHMGKGIMAGVAIGGIVALEALSAVP